MKHVFWKITDVEKEIYAKSNEVFNGYAALKTDPRKEGLPWLVCLQIDLHRWAQEMFNGQPQFYAALGISEEVGELDLALQNNDEEEIKDSIGDVLVYTTQLCTSNRLDFRTLTNDFVSYFDFEHYKPDLSQIPATVGRVSHLVLKREQRIRGMENKDFYRLNLSSAIMRLCACLKTLASSKDIDIKSTFTEVALKVMKRDWNLSKNW